VANKTALQLNIIKKYIKMSQPIILGAAAPTGPQQNVTNPAPPVIIMVQAPAPVKQKIAYEQRFPKKFTITLSSIQLVMGALAIITQIVGLSVRYPDAHYVGTGIWCGIFFALSGLFGIIASLKPSFSTIVTFMVMAIIASVFSFPLLITSSIFTATHTRYIYDGLKHAMFAIQIAISLVQAGAAIASSVMTCKAVCSCCRPMRESGVVYYTNNGGSNATNTGLTNQPIVMPQQHPGYVTIPISQIQAAAASGGAMALPTDTTIPGSVNVKAESPPPKYETVANEEKFDNIDLKDENDTGKGSKYQRFE